MLKIIPTSPTTSRPPRFVCAHLLDINRKASKRGASYRDGYSHKLERRLLSLDLHTRRLGLGYIELRMAKRAAKHVVFSQSKGKWFVKTSGQTIAARSRGYNTQKEAVVAARSVAKKERSALVIHGRDGRIRDVDTYSREASAKKLVPSR